MSKDNIPLLRVLVSVCIGIGVLSLFQNAKANVFSGLNLKSNFTNQEVQKPSEVALQADQVSFSSADNKATAKGHVVVTSGPDTLTCDQLQLDRTSKEVVAQGHVSLDTPQENVIGQGLTYNFDNHTGEFRNARVWAYPFQIQGKKIEKLSDNHMALQEGYVTTSDADQPDYRVGAQRMDVYLKDKMVAHGVKMYLGRVPIFYLPSYTQDLKDRPLLTMVPGYKKEFGAFLLTSLRMKLGPYVKLTLHEDVRQRTGFAEGIDAKYSTPNFGSGLLSTYYTNESAIAGKYYFDDGLNPTSNRQRYRIVWRHKWQINQTTQAIWQYYKIHDYDITNYGFLKEYFEKEYRHDADVDNYFLLTKVMPHGTLTFRIAASQVNPKLRTTEYLPEVQYEFNNQQIGHTGFYLKSTDTYSNIVKKTDPLTTSEKTIRFDTANEISHPMKIGFIQFNPHVGGENTYYSRTADLGQRNVLRGVFNTGADLTTKFYRLWNYKTNMWGMNINGLRHVITPTVSYFYQHRPTFPASHLNQFDTIDALDRAHYIAFGLENELQTKRNGQVVDLIRALVNTNFDLKENPGRGGFQPVTSEVEFNPNSWLSFRSDTEYDGHERHFNSADFDAYINAKNWSFGIGHRYAHAEPDQLTTELDYRINPKWTLRLYDRFYIDGDGIQEQEYTVTRDLHEWQMDITLHQEKGYGSEIYVLFRLKAFPGMNLNVFTTSYNQPREGSQAVSVVN